MPAKAGIHEPRDAARQAWTPAPRLREDRLRGCDGAPLFAIATSHKPGLALHRYGYRYAVRNARARSVIDGEIADA
jgi:hypothetical protein